MQIHCLLRGAGNRPFALNSIVAALTLLAFSPSPRAALVSYWNFDENAGTVITDTSGNPNNHNGNFGAGVNAPAWVPGRLGSAAGFTWQAANNPAGGRIITVPFHADLQMNGPFTVSYWYRMDAATPAGTFPGIMRIGNQSALTGTTVGWGFFRTANMVYKRGNNQPGIFGAMNVGQWYHLALRFDGNLTGNNTIAFLNGVQVNFAAVNGWSNATATTAFEIGRMDAFDQATLDDLALWNEAVSPAKIRSLYTVPTAIYLDYNLADLRAVWSVFDGGPGSSAPVKGTTWSYAATVPGSTTPGDAYLSGGSMYIVLGNGTGVSAPLTLLTGTISPGNLGVVDAFNLIGTPVITVSNANLVFDISPIANDLININGDLNIVNSRVVIDPLAVLTPGNYRLINYTGNKTGTLSVSNTTRYTLAVDEATPGLIDLVVLDGPGSVKWTSTASSAWDLINSNWMNLDSSAADRFFQGDAVLIDDSGAYQTNIAVATPVFPRSITINSSTRSYNITGVEQIGGASEGLVKNGTGSLTLSTPNTFLGQVQVNAGTLRLGNTSALGSTNAQTIIASGATLDLVGTSLGLEPFTAEGSGVGGAGAIINTGTALSNNGLRGRLTLAGDTTFGGVNRWDMINGSLVGDGFKLTKVGAPEIALINLGDTGLGEIDIRQGTLTAQGATRLGDPTKAVTVNTNAALAFWANGSTILDKPVVMNSAIMRNNTSGGADVTTNLGAVTINGDARFELAANIALLGAVSGPGNVVKQGAGTLYLGGANTYAGNTTISAGRLALLASGSLTSPRINVPSTTTFDVSRLAGAYSLASGQTLAGSGTVAGSLNVPTGGTLVPGVENVAGTLPITGGLTLSGGTLNIDIAGAITEGSGVNDLITVAGNLDLTGLTTIFITPLEVLTVGNTYTLINYTGTLTGTEAEVAVVSGSRYTFTLSLATPGKLILSVSAGAAADLAWYGGTPGAENVWDLQTTPNWSDMLGVPSSFFAGDNVIFDDFGLNSTVDLVGSLTPASVRVENGAADYLFQGTGKLSGNSSLTKIFESKLIIANTAVNDFVGPITIDGGTLQVGTGSNFGNLGSGAISNHAALVFNRSDDITVANTISGNANGSLTKQNPNLMVLSGNNAAYSGTITATAGTLRPTHTNALGNATGGTTIAAGAMLDLNALNLGAESVAVAGAGPTGAGAILNNGAGQNNALRFVTLTGDTTVGGSGRWDIRANPTAALNTGGNPYNLTKIGANQVSLVDVVVDPALGDINVQAGTFSVELGTGSGDPTRTMTLANAALLQFFNRSTVWDKRMVLNGGRNIFNNSGASVMNGPVTLNATVTMEVAGTSLTINSNLVGTGALTKTGASPLVLLADNTYPGATTISAGVLQLGGGTNAGWVAGNIVNNSTLTVYRSDTVTVSNTLTGTGTLNVRTPNGLVLRNTVNSGTINVGQDSGGKLILEPGYTGNHANMFLGNPANIPGQVVQSGGSVTVTAQFRVGHWPNEVSTYNLDGGSLAITATPGAVVNQTGAAEQNGILYLGVDGVGIFTQTAGTASAHGIVLDARANTAGEDSFNLMGGRFTVGPSGIKSGSLDANTSYAINLGGGTIASSVNWTSVLRMTFTNVNTTIEQNANVAVLSGALVGPSGLTKRGAGTLSINGIATYAGGTIVNEGTLLVRGSLGAGGGPVTVVGGTLAGDGVINNQVEVVAPGAIAPGLSVGKLTINNFVTLAGNTIMEISKTGSVLTNDSIVGVSTLTYDNFGTLTVIASGTPLADGDTFKLFDAATYTGSFGTLNLPTLPAGLSWDTSRLAVDGTIRAWIPRPSFSFNRSGNSMEVSWPYEFSNYDLQSQTNIPGVGITTNWSTIYPGTNVITFQIDPSAGSVFYRLVKP